MPCVLGIDIAKHNFHTALLQAGRRYNHTFANTPAGFAKRSHWLQKHQVADRHACMEATGRYWEALALYLYEAGIKVSVVNPACICH